MRPACGPTARRRQDFAPDRETRTDRLPGRTTVMRTIWARRLLDPQRQRFCPKTTIQVCILADVNSDVKTAWKPLLGISTNPTQRPVVRCGYRYRNAWTGLPLIATVQESLLHFFLAFVCEKSTDPFPRRIVFSPHAVGQPIHISIRIRWKTISEKDIVKPFLRQATSVCAAFNTPTWVAQHHV
jgi:hypothetical protein